MKKIVSFLFAVVMAYVIYLVAQGFMEAARHGGSVAARERRLAEISKQQNIGLPKQYGADTTMVTTKAGPGLRFTYVFQLVNLASTNIDASKISARMKSKLIENYKSLPELADFRKWAVELRWQYLDKDGKR